MSEVRVRSSEMVATANYCLQLLSGAAKLPRKGEGEHHRRNLRQFIAFLQFCDDNRAAIVRIIKEGADVGR